MRMSEGERKKKKGKREREKREKSLEAAEAEWNSEWQWEKRRKTQVFFKDLYYYSKKALNLFYTLPLTSGFKIPQKREQYLVQS